MPDLCADPRFGAALEQFLLRTQLNHLLHQVHFIRGVCAGGAGQTQPEAQKTSNLVRIQFMEPGHPVAAHRDLLCQDYLLVVPQANQMHTYPFGAEGTTAYLKSACEYFSKLLDVLRLAARVEALRVPMLSERFEQLGYAFLRQHLQSAPT